MQPIQKLGKRFFSRCVARVFLSVVCLSATAGAARADDLSPLAGGRFYVGVSAAAEFLDASYAKITDNRDPRNDSERSGMVFHDNDSANGTGYGFGLLGGYRLPLNDRGLYLIGELDVTFHGGEVKGRLLGVPRNQDVRNNYGQSWPETWAFEKDKSYGLTLKLGGSPTWLTSWTGADASLYVLGGVRHVATKFSIEYTGCPNTTPCGSNVDLTNATDYDRDFLAWVGGAGLEKMIGEHFALRGEARYTWYQRESWVGLADDAKVRVPAELDNGEVGLSLNIVRYF